MKQVTRSIRNEHQREFAKTFEGLCGSHSRWEVWSDFIQLSAITISNVVDKQNEPGRTKDYLTLASKYREKEMQAFASMLATMINGLERNPNQDFLGDLYMLLELSNAHAGQFFTPYSVCTAMAKLSGADIKDRIEEKHWISVNDCACGAGALLVAFANECLMQGVNYQTSVLFTAQDIDYIVGMMCYLQLSLIGAPGYVVIADTIAHPSTSLDSRGLIPKPGSNVWYTPMYFREEWHLRRKWALIDSWFHSLRHETPGEPSETPQTVEPTPSPKKKKKPAQSVATGKSGAIYNETKSGQLTLF